MVSVWEKTCIFVLTVKKVVVPKTFLNFHIPSTLHAGIHSAITSSHIVPHGIQVWRAKHGDKKNINSRLPGSDIHICRGTQIEWPRKAHYPTRIKQLIPFLADVLSQQHIYQGCDTHTIKRVLIALSWSWNATIPFYSASQYIVHLS